MQEGTQNGGPCGAQEIIGIQVGLGVDKEGEALGNRNWSIVPYSSYVPHLAQIMQSVEPSIGPTTLLQVQNHGLESNCHKQRKIKTMGDVMKCGNKSNSTKKNS